MTSAAMETPDVIGWHGGFSTLIECKATRADFLSDKKKWFRRHPENGVGFYRYYMAPDGVITVDELPDRWGLIVVKGDGKTRVLHASERFCEWNQRAEIDLLLSLVRRLKVDPGNHVMIRVYTIESDKEPRASVGLLEQNDKFQLIREMDDEDHRAINAAAMRRSYDMMNGAE